MTTEQAVKWLKDLNKGLAMPQYEDALDMAIQALQAQADCNTCDKAVRDRVGVIGCAKFDSKPTVAIPSAEPCEDAISRQALLKLMGEEPFNWTDSDKELQEVEDYRNFRNMVEQLPSVNPQEPKKEKYDNRWFNGYAN